MSADGEIKLSDFGIARLFGNTRLTSDGGVLGTAEYMAPEQADGRTITDRCDQYSLGGVLYALLAGRPPFRAASLVEMLQLQRFADPEPVTRFAPQTPAELARIIHQLLDKEPQKRFANTLMLARSLEAMERGLSISLSRGDDFVLSPPQPADSDPSDSDPSGYDPQAPTLSPAELAQLERAPATDSPGMSATEATMAFAPAQKLSTGAPEPVEDRDTSRGRFIKVEERLQHGSAGLGNAWASLLAPQTLALALGLVVLVAGGWYLMRPPNADELLRQIEAATASGEIESLEAAQPKIEAFLARYPDDPRSEKLRGMQEDMKQSHPVQRLYTEARRYTFINPELALAKFQALIDVYDDGQSGPETTRHWVKLARQQRTLLQNRIGKNVAEGRKLVESRLEKAEEIAAENPTGARKIYQGIIELYDDKPWAAELVGHAKTALAASPDPQAAAK